MKAMCCFLVDDKSRIATARLLVGSGFVLSYHKAAGWVRVCAFLPQGCWLSQGLCFLTPRLLVGSGFVLSFLLQLMLVVS